MQSDAFLFEPPQPLPFEQGWAWQRSWRDALLADAAATEAVALLEHRPCYTLGRGADLAHLRFDPLAPPAPLHRIDRGGEVTHHMPGQLVAYPVLDLRRRRTDLHWYLRQLEQAVIDVLAGFGLEGRRHSGLTGVWIGEVKVAAIGVGCRRWITQHGLALNVNGSLAGFGAIRPCGLADRSVGRLSDWCGDLSVEVVRGPMARALASRFGLRWCATAPRLRGPMPRRGWAPIWSAEGHALHDRGRIGDRARHDTCRRAGDQ
ncbi:lipoyl(octanoyl) transferase LipB [Synechococcus sp. RSCCF101]|uniref:lipoyl(octanoyl) transferase LipB n=1 Tax=Synechococcus sp. RSCCF101 TaxID=2511069 RepID=UPI001245E7B7|nr:lipoyl(octanoyl) transferase LipB [Synechococcus sp. RSCCF101]QEY33191.1 lipoyl(octanoyl) transferase LipB [Synechococcus sp. RSCCF101]